jgi:hypothetical protein
MTFPAAPKKSDRRHVDILFHLTNALSLVALLIATLSTGIATALAEEIIIRATSALPDEVIELVAESSVPYRMVLRADETPENFITSLCGVYTNAFERPFYKLNKAIADDRRPKPYARPVLMPACVKWQRGEVPVKVLKGDTLDKLLQRKIGRKGGDQLACDPKKGGVRCNATFRELVELLNPSVKNLDDLSNVAELVLPLVTTPTTVRIKKSLDAEELRKKIAILSKQYAADLETSVITNTIALPAQLLATGDLSPNDVDCKNAALVAHNNGMAWPFNSMEIRDVIRRTRQIAERRSNSPSQAIVTLIDTGLDKSFPNKLLKQSTPKDGKGPYGFGVYGPDDIAPFPGYEMGWHGTRVARILAGVSGLTVQELADLVRIKVVDVVRKSESGYDIDPSALDAGINYALDSGHVANVSVGSESSLGSILKMITGKSLLVVVAAGNETHELSDSHPLYPALYGGDHKPGGAQVITVAGYDGNLKLAEFSNWSEHFADVAAPACDVSYGVDDKDVVYGTSFAAPLVTLTAAIIHAFDIEAQPLDIKARIQSSVDFDPNLDGYILWRGRLNIAKALSLYEDVIETRSPRKLSFGEWIPDDPEDVQLCSGGPDYEADKITKIISLRDSPPYYIQIQHREAGLLITDKACEPSGKGMSFFDSSNKQFDLSNKQRHIVPWSKFVDFVKRRNLEYSPLAEFGQSRDAHNQ